MTKEIEGQLPQAFQDEAVKWWDDMSAMEQLRDRLVDTVIQPFELGPSEVK
jgi:hypothetical protein